MIYILNCHDEGGPEDLIAAANADQFKMMAKTWKVGESRRNEKYYPNPIYLTKEHYGRLCEIVDAGKECEAIYLDRKECEAIYLGRTDGWGGPQITMFNNEKQ